MKILELENAPLAELRDMAKELGIPNAARLKKENLIIRVRQYEAEKEGLEVRGGVLEIMNEGIGFLRTNYQVGLEDVYVSQAQLRRYDLRSGDLVIGHVRPPRHSERHYGLLKVESINGLTPEEAHTRTNFENLTPIFPNKRFDLETDRSILSTRVINLIVPIGRGQRGMIVSPPKAGKTTILKHIANAISIRNPEVHLIIALIGERPEEVTDMDRSVDAEVVASTFDEPVTSHVRTAEITLERAKRLVEIGRDVVILMDSLTRLARAYNLVVNPSGRTLSGGMDPSALYPPKRFFGAARNLEEGGSLTIIATALVDTGSRLDDVVYEEFKGTGNMELHLTRKLQERRIFPAIDFERSSTRREDLLLGPDILQRVWLMRRMYIQMTSQQPQGAGMDPAVATEAILQRMIKSKNNIEFLENLTEGFMNGYPIHQGKPAVKTAKKSSQAGWVPWLAWGVAVIMVALMMFLLYQRSPVAQAATAGSKSGVATRVSPTQQVMVSNLPALKADSGVGAIVRETNPHTTIPNRGNTQPVSFKIEKGDSIFGISNQYKIKPETILWSNYDQLNDNPDMISIGMVLNVPPIDGVYYKWQKGETIESVAAKFKASPQDILEWPGNKLDLTNPQIKPGTMIMIPGGSREFKTWIVPVPYAPKSGVIKGISGPGGCEISSSGQGGTGSFTWPAVQHFLSGNDYWSGHLGIDIAAGMGAPVYAADSGTVVYSGSIGGGYGNMVMIDHRNGYHTLYAHMSVLSVVCGQSIGKGALIGLAGTTGNSTGSHLHFEVRLNGGFVNPWYILP